MKTLLPLLLLLGASAVGIAADPPLPAADAIAQLGAISISDGSSYYTFSKGGSFRSNPLGMSGRTMRGRWTTDTDGRFVVTARLGWVNGVSTGEQYRRIVFSISHVYKRTGENAHPPFNSSVTLFDCYFLIDELTTTTKPAEDFPE